MAKKGVIDEIFSKARFSGDSDSYIISFRDLKKIRVITMTEFINKSENFQKIPASRITKIKKNNMVLFEKNFKQDD